MVNGNFPSYHPSDVSQPWPGETTTMSTLAFCLEMFPLCRAPTTAQATRSMPGQTQLQVPPGKGIGRF